ncbi:hypothetical protein NQ314_001560 [Rhamnusium bicolor]|uniref:HTH psq-type domain-containing protein n=1 Tax=Rhamnusium bicolor TaxID=1586634 RepID=A0AAV8ZRZ2_9CUCU|nr:hypothetical protein NQ314_001560 [Rhamnusium bicolor]
MAPIKRNHKTLSLKKKSAIIDELKRGVSGKSLALKYGVGTLTISDIKKKSDKIKGFVLQCVAGPGKRQTLKQAEYPKMEKKLSSDTAAVEPFINELDQTIKSIKLQPSQIYNADESALFWKLLLDSTLKNAGKPKYANDLEDDSEDWIPLSVMRQKILSLAEEIDAVSSMLHSIGNVDIDAGETIDWINSDAKLIGHENLIHANNSADSDDDVMEIATPVRIKNEDAVKSLNFSLEWATENDIPLKDIMTLQISRKLLLKNNNI